eukprot:1117692-Rhodomonas_salina.1
MSMLLQSILKSTRKGCPKLSPKLTDRSRRAGHTSYQEILDDLYLENDGRFSESKDVSSAVQLLH